MLVLQVLGSLKQADCKFRVKVFMANLGYLVRLSRNTSPWEKKTNNSGESKFIFQLKELWYRSRSMEFRSESLNSNPIVLITCLNILKPSYF